MELHVKRFDELTTYELFQIYKLRAEVFVLEQNCAYQDIDSYDLDAYHVWISKENEIVAYARVLRYRPEDSCSKIGRVIAAERGCGLGRKIVTEAISTAVKHFNAEHIFISAQTQARGFYEKCGFRAVSDEYLEDGIPHVGMMLDTTVADIMQRR